MNEPGVPKARPRPAPGDGGVAVGSGKVDRPCLRMHWASASIASLRLSDTGPLGGPAPGISFAHAVCADRNAGDCGLDPDPGPIWIPLPEPGSGKFGTPWARMQLANLIGEGTSFDPDPLPDMPEEPHPVSGSAQPMAAHPIAMTRRRVGAPTPVEPGM